MYRCMKTLLILLCSAGLAAAGDACDFVNDYIRRSEAFDQEVEIRHLEEQSKARIEALEAKVNKLEAQQEYRYVPRYSPVR